MNVKLTGFGVTIAIVAMIAMISLLLVEPERPEHQDRFVSVAQPSNSDCRIFTIKDTKTGACFVQVCASVAPAPDQVCQ